MILRSQFVCCLKDFEGKKFDKKLFWSICSKGILSPFPVVFVKLIEFDLLYIHVANR